MGAHRSACVLAILLIAGGTRCHPGDVETHRLGQLDQLPGLAVLTLIRMNLEHYTVFSPDWKVTEDRGAKVADLRNIATFLGEARKANAPEWRTLRVRIRFSPYRSGGPAWGVDERYSVVKLSGRESPKIEIKVWHDDGVWRSVLIVAAEHLWFEIEEITDQIQRQMTVQALAALGKLCRQVQRYSELAEIRSEFAISGQQEIPALALTPLLQKGRYRAVGYVNPREPGFITIRVFRKNGEELSELKAHRTLEYVGWSPSGDERFHFESELTIDGEGPDEEVRIEVRFQPRSEKTLFSVDTTISKWTR